MDLSVFSSFPGLAQDFCRRDWECIFDRQTLSRAKNYLNSSRILNLTVFKRDGSVTLSANVRGSLGSFYDTEIQLFQGENRTWRFMEDCSCPVGRECKHAAALLMKVADLLEELPQGLQQPAETGDFELTEWLSRVTAPPKTETDTKEKKPNTNFVAYCIKAPEFSYTSELILTLHVGRTLKSGEVRINLNSGANADPVRRPKYMKDEDVLPCTLYYQILRSQYQYDGIRLEGSQVPLLLEKILETGRLFFVNSNSAHYPVIAGEVVTPEPVWESQADGSARPAFGPPMSEALGIIPTEPPYLLRLRSDQDSIALDTLELGGRSLEFLDAWISGPTLSPEQVVTAAVELQKRAPSLPAPVPLETKKLKKSKPTIHLDFIRKNPFTHGGLHLSGQPEPIVAKLSFEYHGHSFRPDLSAEPPRKASFTSSEKKVIYTIPRDTQFEREVILNLVQEYDMVPASVHDPSVHPDHCSAILPHTDPFVWDDASAEFINCHVPHLREQGWEITIDTSAQVEVHTIGPDDLDTGLTELPDHGIDWFQFSASYLTPSGEKQPLLPLLSSYLKHLDFESIDQTLETLDDSDQTFLKDPESPNTYLTLPTLRLLKLAKTLHDLFGSSPADAPLHRLQAANLADVLEMDSSQTLKDLAQLGNNLKNITTLPKPAPPKNVVAELRDYQLEGFHWMQFLARHSLHGILADDMGLGKTLQALAHLQAEVSGRRTKKRPSLVLAPTSVVGNWQNEAKKFTPKLKTLLLHGPERKERFQDIPKHHLVITSYALLVRDFEILKEHDFHLVILDEAQYIKNPAAKMSQLVCKLSAAHRISLSGTPLENHLGELWSQMRFLMPGLLGSSDAFRKHFRTPIEKHQNTGAQISLNSRVAPLILRRTKDQVATELPPKTEILHTIPLNPGQVDIYETVRAAMDDRIRDAIADKGLAKSQIIVLDALLKLRQICCHPQILKLPAAQKIKDSAKLDFLTSDLLPTLLEEGRKILIFSTFTTMLALIEKHLKKQKIPFSKITGSTKNRQTEIDQFQKGETPVFLISLKAGGTGLNLTAADTVIHYDPWWNPAAENQATDRAYRIGQDKPVFVHKLISEGTIEERIVELQAQKAKLVEALLSEKTSKLQLDQETLGNLLAPIE